jgi:hypothetical protein
VCRQLWKRRENSGRRRRTPGLHCTACTLRPSVELTASLRQWPVWRLLTARQIEWGSSCRHLFGWGLSALRHPTAENFRKGGVHEVGTVVSTTSAQFASNTHVGSDKRYYKLPSAWRPWPWRLQVNVLAFAQTELQLTDNGAPPRCVACQVQGSGVRE